MGVIQLFYGLVLAHFVADYMQPAALVAWTKRTGGGLYVHAGVYAILTAAVLYGYGPWYLWTGALAVTVGSHLLFDKLKYSSSDRVGKNYVWGFLLDQALHAGVIVAVTAFMVAATRGRTDFSPFIMWTAGYERALTAVTAAIGASFGGSILVFEALRTFAPENDGRVVSFADRMPGIVERGAAAVLLFGTPWFWLFPVPFVYSAGRLAREWRTKKRWRASVDFLAGLVSFAMAAGLYYFKYLL